MWQCVEDGVALQFSNCSVAVVIRLAWACPISQACSGQTSMWPPALWLLSAPARSGLWESPTLGWVEVPLPCDNPLPQSPSVSRAPKKPSTKIWTPMGSVQGPGATLSWSFQLSAPRPRAVPLLDREAGSLETCGPVVWTAVIQRLNPGHGGLRLLPGGLENWSWVWGFSLGHLTSIHLSWGRGFHRWVKKCCSHSCSA